MEGTNKNQIGEQLDIFNEVNKGQALEQEKQVIIKTFRIGPALWDQLEKRVDGWYVENEPIEEWHAKWLSLEEKEPTDYVRGQL